MSSNVPTTRSNRLQMLCLGNNLYHTISKQVLFFKQLFPELIEEQITVTIESLIVMQG